MGVEVRRVSVSIVLTILGRKIRDNELDRVAA